MTGPLILHPLQTNHSGGLSHTSKPPLLMVTIVPDDSGSISTGHNAEAIRRGHNAQLDVYRTSPINVLIRTRYLNGHELFEFRKPRRAVRMNEQNYNPLLGTPLYRETFKVLDEVTQSAALYVNQYDVFTMTYIMTDGADTGSSIRPEQVKAVVDRMFASGRHVVAGIGVRDGSTDFVRVFQSMGIPEQWIMVLERGDREIVRGMTYVAETSVSVIDEASFICASQTGFSESTRMAGPLDVAHMMGAAPSRSRFEKGNVPREELDWSPLPQSKKFNQATMAYDIPIPTPCVWHRDGFYDLSLPGPNQIYVFGRDSTKKDLVSDTHFQAFIRSRWDKNPNLELIAIKLHDTREPSPLSRTHGAIEYVGPDLFKITAITGDISLISGDATSSDLYLQGKKNEFTTLKRNQRVKLEEKVIFRVK